MNKIALIPAYEPDERLIEITKKLYENQFTCVIVNDGSGKKYEQIFNQCKDYASIISYEENKGKGFALKIGFNNIKNRFVDYAVVTVDADGQHKVEDAEKIIQYAINNPNILVLGMRKRKKETPMRSKIGNSLTRLVYKMTTHLDIYDTQTGLRAFSENLIDEMINIRGDRYEYEMNVLLEFAKKGIKMKEIEIETIYIENNNSSHFNAIKDSVKIYKQIIKFSLSSITAFIIDYGLFSIFSTILKNIILSNILARIISSIYNFFINKLIVFKSKENTAKAYIKYFILAVIILILNTVLLNLLVNTIQMNKYVAKILVEIILFIGSWIVQKKLIFKNRKEE